jgi:hypothetical protein
MLYRAKALLLASLVDRHKIVMPGGLFVTRT